MDSKTFKMIKDLKNKNAQLRTDILAALYTIHQNEKNRLIFFLKKFSKKNFF